jgi:hypothetical protein
MSSQCLSIKVIDTPASVPDWQRINGYAYLDTDDDFNVRASKKLEQLEIGQIEIESVLGFSLPGGPLNDLILRSHVLPNVIDNNFESIRVVIMAGSRALRQTDLFILGYNAGGNPTYDVEIRTAETDHWIVGAKNLMFEDINLGGLFTFEEATVTAQNALGQYIDGDIGIRFPLVYFGAWSSKNGIQLIDFRPQYSLLWLLQQGFCALGWSFRSNAFESEYGRRLITYMLDKNYGQDPNLIASRAFNVALTTDIDMFPPENNAIIIIFDNVLSNPGGNYDETTGKYGGACVADFYVKIPYKFKGSSSSILNHNIVPIDVTTKLYYAHPVFGTVVIESQVTNFTKTEYQDDQFYYVTHEFVARNVQVDPGSQIFVLARYDDDFANNGTGSLQILEGAQFWNDPKQIFLQDGDTFYPSSLLDKSVKFLDFVKGCAHLISGKFATDFNNKVVWLDCPYQTINSLDEVVAGFFEETSDGENLNEIKVEGSEKSKTPNNNFKRYFQLKFKGDGDAAVKSLNLPDKQPLYSHTIDYGAAYPEEYEESPNPFFEPTLNKKITGITTSLEPIDMPWMVESIDDTPKLSYNLGPRVLYWNGVNELWNQYPPGSPNTLGQVAIKIFNIDTDQIPYAFQLANSQTQGIIDPPALPSLIYGDDINLKDLFNQYWKTWLFQTTQNLQINLLLLIEKVDYFKYDFKKKYVFDYLGRATVARMIEVNDFQMCDNSSTPVVFLPEKRTADACLNPVIPNANLCNFNAPQLIITLDDGCYTFSLGGVNVSPVAFVVFEWHYIGDPTWTTAGVLCDPEGAFEVRMTVNYADDCPIIYRRRTIDICGNSPEISFDYDYENNCVEVLAGGVNQSVVQYVVIIYSYDGGVTWQPSPYTLYSCLPVGEHTDILFQATFYYSDGCPPIEITQNFSIPVVPPICNGTTADATCDTLGNITLTGVVVGEVAMDLLVYRLPGATIWQLWDGVSVINPCPFEYRRLIFFCDDCPTYCGDIHTCECSSCLASVMLDFGTVLGNDGIISTVENCDGAVYSWEIDTGGGFVALPDTTPDIIITDYGVYRVTIDCDDDCTDSATIEVIEPPCEVPLGTPIQIETC